MISEKQKLARTRNWDKRRLLAFQGTVNNLKCLSKNELEYLRLQTISTTVDLILKDWSATNKEIGLKK